ncbi:ABC transporter permease subunit [Candidatus Poribacteria bacterium]|nr:ABC transporter permease subunit [Candidatus Poribacteria bacterium]
MNAITTRAERRQTSVLQRITFIILGMACIPIWNVLQETHAADTEAASAATPLNTFSPLLDDLYTVLSISFVAILFGIACAFYLQEWLPETNWIRRFIESVVAILGGIPSIFSGILATGVFFSYAGTLKTVGVVGVPQDTGDVSALEPLSFQQDTPVFYIVVLTFLLMVTPLTIKTTQAALRSVATPIREAAYALGASHWQVLKKQVIPIVFTRILATGCRAMSSALATVALIFGIYVWQYTNGPGEMVNRFILFLSSALFLSIFSSVLIRLYASTSADPTNPTR